ncbi:hypothetical protein SAMN04488109_5345 [Chryseolinea serpens]|uniref:Uncharacterized protein n=1 Tax=Chryseolinea serpens TaxID=947013 RepID=A0A1M5VRN4_9BACT|nr:hypothetical protein SAMN04488109_5345 [Chryseolinea serpens]
MPCVSSVATLASVTTRTKWGISVPPNFTLAPIASIASVATIRVNIQASYCNQPQFDFNNPRIFSTLTI